MATKWSMTKNSIRIRIRTTQDGEQVFKALIMHPMETGQRRNYKTRELIPADYIDVLQIHVDDNPYLEVGMGINGSRNPFLSFVFTQAVYENQRLRVSWVDNRKREIAYEWALVPDEKGGFALSGDQTGTEVVEALPVKGPVCRNVIRTKQR